MDVSDSGSRDCCVLHSCYSAKKGTKVPRKCLPRMEDEDQGCRGGGGGGEEGSHCGSLVEGDPATANWTGERKPPSGLSRRAANATRSSGLVSPVGYCHCFIGYSPPSPVTGAVADALETKPVYLLWFVFTCLETPGKSKPGVIPCHDVLLLKARKVYFSVTQWRHTPEKRGRGEKKQRHERVTFELES